MPLSARRATTLSVPWLQAAHFAMAKNTGASRFRKVDVDQYDDDKFVEENEADAEGADSQGANDAEVTTLIAQYPYYIVIVYVGLTV